MRRLTVGRPDRCYRRRAVRAPPNAIVAPPFPRKLKWFNVAMLRMEQQRGGAVLGPDHRRSVESLA